MKYRNGFTLTELLTVVSVFALMTAVAVPRYLAINSETRANSVFGLAAHVENSARLTNRVWKSAGRPSQIVIDGDSVDMQFGYPTDQSIGDVVVKSTDFTFSDGYWKHADTARNQRCAVLYVPPSTATSNAEVTIYTDGC